MSKTKNEIDPQTLVFKDGRQQVQVDADTNCWVWLGYKCRGYGRCRDGKRPSVQAHRVLYKRMHGSIPRGMDLGHTCHRRSCVNPDHVRPIPKQQNNDERFQIPSLGAGTLTAIEAAFVEEKPNLWISYEFGISVWYVRKLAQQRAWRDQFTLDLEVPF